MQKSVGLYYKWCRESRFIMNSNSLKHSVLALACAAGFVSVGHAAAAELNLFTQGAEEIASADWHGRHGRHGKLQALVCRSMMLVSSPSAKKEEIAAVQGGYSSGTDYLHDFPHGYFLSGSYDPGDSTSIEAHDLLLLAEGMERAVQSMKEAGYGEALYELYRHGNMSADERNDMLVQAVSAGCEEAAFRFFIIAKTQPDMVENAEAEAAVTLAMALANGSPSAWVYLTVAEKEPAVVLMARAMAAVLEPKLALLQDGESSGH